MSLINISALVRQPALIQPDLSFKVTLSEEVATSKAPLHPYEVRMHKALDQLSMTWVSGWVPAL